MACRMFGAKPISEPMLSYGQFDSREQISVKFESKFCHFHSRKCIWKCRLPKWRPFCPGGDELMIMAWCCIYSSQTGLSLVHTFACRLFRVHSKHESTLTDWINVNKMYKNYILKYVCKMPLFAMIILTPPLWRILMKAWIHMRT